MTVISDVVAPPCITGHLPPVFLVFVFIFKPPVEYKKLMQGNTIAVADAPDTCRVTSPALSVIYQRKFNNVSPHDLNDYGLTIYLLPNR
jgi:hypothetical protein